MTKQLKTIGTVDFGYIPDFSLFMNSNELVRDIMPNIHNNPNVPEDIKNACIEILLINNIDKLYESPY